MLIVHNINLARKFSVPNRWGLKAHSLIQWNLQLLEDLLTSYTDKEVVQWLKYGWPLGRDQFAPQPGWAEDNHVLAKVNPVAVEKYIEKEIQKGSTIGPFPRPPFAAPIGKSPLATRNKRNSKEKRVISDYSWPLHNSINDQISKLEYMGSLMHLAYPNVDVLAKRTAEIGTSARMWKKDLSRWFKQIYLSYEDVPLQGFVWKNKWYFDLTLTMGCRTAPYIAMRCSLAFKYIHNEMGYFLVAYCDDFSGVEDGEELATRSFNTFGSMIRDLRVEEAVEKSVAPAPVIVFLGTGIDAINQVIFVVPERIIEIRYELEQWRFKTWCTRNQLESIIGKLQFCSNCVRMGRIFICRLLNALRTMKRNKFYIISPEVRADLRWWWNFLPYFKATYILWPEEFKLPGEILQTDSSKKAIGVVCRKNYFSARFPEWMQAEQRNIADLEFLAILVSLKKWTKILAGKSIVLRCDNMSMVEVINSGKAKNRFLQHGLRELAMICCLNSIKIRCQHILGKFNYLPDLLSRWFHSAEYRRKFRALTVNWGYVRQHINPEMFKLTCDW